MDVMNLKDKTTVLSVHSGLMPEERVGELPHLSQALLHYVNHTTHGDTLEEAYWMNDVAAYFLIPTPEGSHIILFAFRVQQFDLRTAQQSIRQFLPTLFSHLHATLS